MYLQSPEFIEEQRRFAELETLRVETAARAAEAQAQEAAHNAAAAATALNIAMQEAKVARAEAVKAAEDL